jgi:hypothetical protein
MTEGKQSREPGRNRKVKGVNCAVIISNSGKENLTQSPRPASHPTQRSSPVLRPAAADHGRGLGPYHCSACSGVRGGGLAGRLIDWLDFGSVDGLSR